MKNLRLKSLLAAAVLVCQSVAADASAEKGRTFFMPVNVCSSTYQLKNVDRLNNMEKDDSKFGLTFVASAFYQQACGNRSTGKLAEGLANGKENKIKFYGGAESSANGDVMLRRVFIPAGVNAVTPAPAPTAVSNYDNTQNATIELSKLEHKRVGGGLDLLYNADNLYSGLFFGAALTFLQEKNKLSVKSEGTPATANLVAPATAVLNMLSGTTQDATLQPVQALKALKIKDGQVLSRTALNEVVLCAGLQVLNNETAELCFAVVGSIPCGQERKSDFLFQANPGERQYGLGIKGNGLLKLVCEDDYKIDLHAGACWKYAFKKSGEKYIPQVKDQVWGQYQLASKGYDTEIQPLVNILAETTTNVGSASEFDAFARLAFEKGSFGASLGYNLGYVQEKSLTYDNFPKEKVYLANEIVSGTTEQVAVAAPVKPLKFSAAPGTALTSVTTRTLSETDLVAAEPSKLTHNVSGEVNWTFCGWEYPVVVGLGAGYQLANERTHTPEYWTVGVRGGVNF